jgi:hypothetical protein
MWAKLPTADRDAILEYCKGVNDTIEQVYAGSLPEPLEINLLRTVLGLSADLFGNATNISDQVDPSTWPGGADPQRPLAGFQFTPEMAIAIAILEVRNFGIEGFDEPARLAELQALIATKAGPRARRSGRPELPERPPRARLGPDATTPGFGGPLASRGLDPATALAARLPRYDWNEMIRRARRAARVARVRDALGRWPMMGSYAWFIGAGKSATGYPWLGGFRRPASRRRRSCTSSRTAAPRAPRTASRRSAWSSPAPVPSC